MLERLHFEVAVPGSDMIDSGGFIIDNEDGKRARNPRFRGIVGGTVTKGAAYRVAGPTPGIARERPSGLRRQR